MDPFVKSFVQSSLLWFLLGITLGLAMAIHPAWVVYRPAHAHMNLLGFVVMMIYGVGYQLLPRLFGHPIHNAKLAFAHLWIANVGLALMVVGFFLAPNIGDRSVPVTATGGTLATLGGYIFVYNMWRTMQAAERRRRERDAAGGRKLPSIGQE